MTSGFAKYYHLTFNQVLKDVSYVNLIMYNSVIPDYSSKEDKKEVSKGMNFGSFISKMKGVENGQ